jgi:hypothetical protein
MVISNSIEVAKASVFVMAQLLVLSPRRPEWVRRVVGTAEAVDADMYLLSTRAIKFYLRVQASW